MILTSTKAQVADRYTPPWHRNEEKAPVYLLRAGTVIEREQLEAELAGALLAGPVWPWELQEAVLAGFRELGGEDAEALIALAEADQAGALESDAEKRQLAEALEILAQYWPPYRRLREQQARRNALIPAIAFRHFCVGWENIDPPFKRGFDQKLTAEAMGLVDPLDLRAAGMRAYNLQYGGGEEKNSDAPSKSGDVPEISNMGAPSLTDGSSGEPDMQKTPG